MISTLEACNKIILELYWKNSRSKIYECFCDKTVFNKLFPKKKYLILIKCNMGFDTQNAKYVNDLF